MTMMRAPGRYGYADLPGLMAKMSGDEKHDFAAESTLDVLWVLYDQVLRVTPETADWPSRDRFYLSKGHGPMAYYAVLAARGFLPESELPSFGEFGSPLGQHPDRALVPGAEISSGSLGHGLPLAVGTALGLRAQAQAAGGARVFVLIGDGELDEGSNAEAIAYAGRAGLGQLTAVIIDNGSATWGWPGGIETRFTVEGWSAQRVHGRDHGSLGAALAAPHPGRPHAVVAVIPREI